MLHCVGIVCFSMEVSHIGLSSSLSIHQPLKLLNAFQSLFWITLGFGHGLFLWNRLMKTFEGFYKVVCLLLKCRVFFFVFFFLMKDVKFPDRSGPYEDFMYVLLAQIAECILLAGHGMLPSIRKALRFWMSRKQDSWSNDPTEQKCFFSSRIVWSCLSTGAACSCHPYSTPPWFGLVPSVQS